LLLRRVANVTSPGTGGRRGAEEGILKKSAWKNSWTVRIQNGYIYISKRTLEIHPDPKKF
jgi:hypothetical protein